MASPKITIVNVGYRSTNFWVVSAGTQRILIDLGWPGMVGTLLANLERKGIPLREIVYGIATHYHIDHAGAAQDLKNRGMRLLVTEEQVEAIPMMKRWTKPSDHYTEIVPQGNVVIRAAEGRDLFAKIGISAEIVHTPGHSDDSVSVVLESGDAFTGDLTAMEMIASEDPAVVERSWTLVRATGATMVYGGHGFPYPI
jgi:glyoxylase-like metal-dependent hydrolase (beta-lactamase superfamily II)